MPGNDQPPIPYSSKNRLVLPPRQLLIFAIIVQRCHRRQKVTIDILRQLTGVRSPNGIQEHLEALRKKGFITWDEHKHGSIRPTHQIVLFREM